MYVIKCIVLFFIFQIYTNETETVLFYKFYQHSYINYAVIKPSIYRIFCVPKKDVTMTNAILRCSNVQYGGRVTLLIDVNRMWHFTVTGTSLSRILVTSLRFKTTKYWRRFDAFVFAGTYRFFIHSINNIQVIFHLWYSYWDLQQVTQHQFIIIIWRWTWQFTFVNNCCKSSQQLQLLPGRRHICTNNDTGKILGAKKCALEVPSVHFQGRIELEQCNFFSQSNTPKIIGAH